MKKRVADITIETIIDLGITDCFSVVGGGAMHLNNAFAIKKDYVNVVYTHHEQAAAMAAEGYARLSGRMAAVCVTSGPGGLNTLNGVQGAWVDSIPMLIISGHPRLATTVQATGLKLRNRGVQENDIISQVQSITKYAIMVTNPLEIESEIRKAYTIAMDGRRGPVWVCVPLDIQGQLVEDEQLIKFDEKEISERLVPNIIQHQVEEIVRLLKEAERPCILTGSGIRSSDSEELYRKFIEIVRIPIVGGALQPDINYNGENFYYGGSGTVGPRVGNYILQNADCILILGNSMSFKQTGYNVDRFAPNAKKIMVDAEPDEAKKPGLNVDLSVVCDLKEFFKSYIDKGTNIETPNKWKRYCDFVYTDMSRFEMIYECEQLSENNNVPSLLFWKNFLDRIEDNAVISLGNSSCIVGALQFGVNTSKQRVLVNYNCGSMGDDITEAIGAAVCYKDVPHYCVTGDGSVMMNLQEFQTIHHYNLPVKTVIMNNGGYGAIRSTCNNFFKGIKNGCDEKSGISFPDFGDVASTFGLKYHLCHNIKELKSSIDWLIAQDDACILEIHELYDEIRGPRLESVMDENGEFHTPDIQYLAPFINEKELLKYEYDYFN